MGMTAVLRLTLLLILGISAPNCLACTLDVQPGSLSEWGKKLMQAQQDLSDLGGGTTGNEALAIVAAHGKAWSEMEHFVILTNVAQLRDATGSEADRRLVRVQLATFLSLFSAGWEAERKKLILLSTYTSNGIAQRAIADTVDGLKELAELGDGCAATGTH